MLANKLMQASKAVAAAPVGQVAYTTPGTYTWTVPAGVTSICAVCVAGGGSGGGGPNASGGGGGGLHWRNDIPVTSGEILSLTVGNTGSESNIQRSSTLLVRATGGGNGSGSQNVGSYGGSWQNMGSGKEGGGSGGSGGGIANGGATGGGGAAGYSGNGGSTYYISNGGIIGSTAGTGGGGGGGAGVKSAGYSSGGGGVGIFGQGANGAANGGAGSGGSGQYYGGGGGARRTTGAQAAGLSGAPGAVRIIWGTGRAFPSTLTTDQ